MAANSFFYSRNDIRLRLVTVIRNIIMMNTTIPDSMNLTKLITPPTPPPMDSSGFIILRPYLPARVFKFSLYLPFLSYMTTSVKSPGLRPNILVRKDIFYKGPVKIEISVIEPPVKIEFFH